MDTLFIIPEQFSLKNKEHINLLQQALTAIDAKKYPIDKLEFDRSEYGLTTQKAVVLFQQDFSLKQNATNILSDTVEALNRQLDKLYRICGSLSDAYGNSISSIEVTITETRTKTELGKAKSFADGSYRIYLTIDQDYFNNEGLLLYPLSITISCGQLFSQDNILIKDLESVFNVSSDAFASTGIPLYYSLTGTLRFAGAPPDSLPDKTPQELFNISTYTNIDINLLMKLMFAHMKDIDLQGRASDIVLGYLYQNYPVNVPRQLFDDSFLNYTPAEWASYKDDIKNLILNGFIMMSKQQFLDLMTTAVNQKYIPYQTEEQLTQNCRVIYSHYVTDVILTAHFLEGDDKALALQDIFKLAGVTEKQLQLDISYLFTAYVTDFNQFLSILENGDIVPKQYKESLIIYFQLSRITRNYLPLIEKIRDAYLPDIKDESVRFLASLNLETWKELIGNSYPSKFDNNTYAKFVMNNISEIFSDITIIEEIESSGLEFSKLSEIKAYLLEENPGFNLLTDRLDQTGKDAEFVRQFTQIQNVFRITPSPEAATVLLENNIKSAGQIYFMGKELLEEKLISRLNQADID
ncbi:MAG: hypothetical protein LBL18_00475, partial [Bacteroidales bacterium]|nr:hypothetical protein [Bacteroidales bacterium]